MATYDRHLEKVRGFFGSPVAFHTALKHARSVHSEQFCRACTDAARLNQLPLRPPLHGAE